MTNRARGSFAPVSTFADLTCYPAKHGQDIRYPSAERTGSYPVRTSSKSYNCYAETGKRVKPRQSIRYAGAEIN
jgi:hypothetical protein